MQHTETGEAEEFIYLAFENPKNSPPVIQRGVFRSAGLNAIKFLVSKIIPVANPDFENQFHKVASWLVECGKDSGFPNREIGLDIEGRPIMKLPYLNNYGYWTDNNLSATDFINQFKAIETTALLFEDMWLQYE